ncbi:ABC transporter ATP-binding protein [Actinomadura macra]|uniref:ABC transporter ATP-binding protein n=1 Tax=Actinomadura macra TaxID=46164 RepID=UPI00082EA1B0|nr:ABC transporter ATP-binding protein [Actinomadura macra]
MLDVVAVSAGYEAKTNVISDVSVRVGDGEIVTVLGPNGAGKSTLMRVIMGMLSPGSGEVRLGGKPLTGLSTRQIVRRGIALCPERRHLFPAMTVQDNLRLGAYSRPERTGVRQDMDRLTEMFPVLGKKRRLAAGVLSGGEQQMLTIARALMGRPKLLLLDEPSLGLAPILVETVAREIKSINADGLSVLLVEQNAHIALDIAARAYVLEGGRVVLEGSAAELTGDDKVRAAYLGLA